MMTLLTRFFLVSVLILTTASGAGAQLANADECPESQFTQWGANGVVTPGESNNVRAEPSTSAALVGRIAPGEPFNVIYKDPVCTESYIWREIQTIDMRGWTVEIPIGGDEPFIVPYVPEQREVGQLGDDGSVRVEESGITFTIPAELGITRVTVTPEVGLFGDVMSAQPSSVRFEFWDDSDNRRGKIEIFPYAVYDASYEYLSYSDLETLLAEQPDLLEYAARNRMPQLPIGGVAALFGGAGAYTPFASGSGLRFITYFAQDWIVFSPDMGFSYLFRGISADQDFFIAGQFPVQTPPDAVPPRISLSDETYAPYLRRFEANLAAQPTSAFTPDLALYDALFNSLTITDNQALLTLIP